MPMSFCILPADYDPREEDPGTAPFSEPEAALVLRTATALRPHVWASVHSGMEALFMPYDHVASIPGGVTARLACFARFACFACCPLLWPLCLLSS